MNAVRGGSPFPELDKTFNPTLLYGEGNLFNFGYVHVRESNSEDEAGHHLFAEIRDASGFPREESYLEIAPR